MKSMNRVHAVVTYVLFQVRIVILGLYYRECSYNPTTLGRPMERPTFLSVGNHTCGVVVCSYSMGLLVPVGTEMDTRNMD